MSNKRQMKTVSGLATARGFAAGPVFIYRGDSAIPAPAYVIEPGCEGDELLRLKRALVETRRDLENLVAALRERTDSGDVKVFECHQMMLEDPELIGEIERYIRNERVNAEAAVRRAIGNARQMFERMNDAYFRERIRDLEDVERRLLKALTGFGVQTHCELKRPSIVVADDLTPSETVQLPRELVLGFATNGGSTTSHVALLARALGIPAVTGLVEITSLVKAGETIVLDGSAGTVTINPDENTIHEYGELIARQEELSRELRSGMAAGTLKDGGEIALYANVHPGVPLDMVIKSGARGVGLYRSEYLWLNRELEPTEEEQFIAYKEAAEAAARLAEGASLTIRALDIGGDKLVRGISAKEANPFLGNRSIRYLLSNRDVFRTQLRAILKASVFGKVRLMYPMISCVEELSEAAAILAEVKAQLDAEGVAYDASMPVGAMIEVPAAAINARALAKHVDFFSIGTNDLIQYSMAADRGNETVAHLYQPTNPAIIALMRITIDAAKAEAIHVGVCGESASDVVTGVLWAAMGVDTLSMSATYIPMMSKLFSRLTRGDLDDYAKMVADLGNDRSGAEICEACNAFLRSRVADLDDILL